MANAFTLFARRYPITFWLSVGGFAYVWKASQVGTMYDREYQEFQKQRIQELQNAK